MPDIDTILEALPFLNLREILYVAASGASILGLVFTRRVLRVVSTQDKCLKELAEVYYCLRTLLTLSSTSLGADPIARSAQIETDTQRVCDARTNIKRLLESIAGVEFDHESNHFVEIARGLEKRGEAATARWLYERAERLHENGRPLNDEDLERCRRGLETCYCALWEVDKIKQRWAGREPAVLVSAGVYARCLTTYVFFHWTVTTHMFSRRKHTALVAHLR